MFEKIKKLLIHALVYGIGNSGSQIVGFILLPLYSRYLTPADYGVLALVGMFGQVLFTFTNMGQSPALFRRYFVHDDPEGRETVISTSLWLILTVSFPIGLLALILSKPLTTLLTGSPEYTVWVMLGIGVVMFKTLLRLPLVTLRAREESRRFALCSFAQTVISLVLAIFFVVGLLLGGRGVLLSQLLAQIVLCLYLIPYTLRGLSFKFSRHDAGDMLGYGVYLIPTALCSFVIQLSDRYFLKHYGSLHDVGLYSLVYRLGEFLTFPMEAFELAWPQFLFSNQKNPAAPALYARTFTYFLTFMGFLCLGVSLFSKEVIELAVAPAFHEAYRVVPWIAAALFFKSLNYAGNVGISLHRKVKYRPLILAVAAVVNISLNFLLIPTYGMMGAAIATLVSYFVQGVLRLIVSHHLYPVPYEYARLGRSALIILGLYYAGVTIPWGTVWAALAGKAALMLCVPLLLFVSGFFEPGELERLKGIVSDVRRWSGGSLPARSVGK
jgi:O-antigen/teichoic acid export membrane protein